MGAARREYAPLLTLPTSTAPPRAPSHFSRSVSSISHWSLPRVALVVLVVLCAATSLALVRISSLSNELLANLQQHRHALVTTSLSSRASFHPAPSAVAADTQIATMTGRDVRVLIVYSNGTHLSQLAAAVERGVRQTIAQPEQLRTRIVEDASFQDDVLWADAVILGSHVVNANVEPKMAEFMSRWVFSEDLSHKVGAGFVTGGGLSAGEELTMVNLLHSMLIFRMIVVGGERWTSAFGASAIVSEGPFQPLAQVSPSHESFPPNCYPRTADELHEMFKDKAEGLGRRVTTVASLLVPARKS